MSELHPVAGVPLLRLRVEDGRITGLELGADEADFVGVGPAIEVDPDDGLTRERLEAALGEGEFVFRFEAGARAEVAGRYRIELPAGVYALSVGDRGLTLATGAGEPVEVEVAFALFIRRGGFRVGVPFIGLGEDAYPFRAKVQLSDGGASIASWSSAGIRFDCMLGDAIEGEASNLRVEALAGRLFRGAGEAFEAVQLNEARVERSEGGLVVSTDVELRLGGGESMAAGRGRIPLHADLSLNEGASFIVTLEEDVWLPRRDPSSPFTILVRAGTELKLGLDPLDPSIEFRPAARGTPAVSVFVPGVSPSFADGDDPGAEGRFAFDLADDAEEGGGSEQALTWRPGGLTLTAVARPTTLGMGQVLRDVFVEEGRFSLRSGDYDVRLSAAARLEYFDGAAGRLTLRAASGAGAADGEGRVPLSVQFEPLLSERWTDPSGHLAFDKPSLVVKITWADGWKVEGTLGGTLSLLGPADPSAWVKGAGEWLGDVFDSLSLEFDGLPLASLADLDTSGIRLAIKGGDLGFSLWDLIDVRLDGFRLAAGGFDFSGDFRLAIEGGFAFAGRLPRLGVRFDGGRIAIDPGGLGLSGELEAPSGLRARLELQRDESPGREGLTGRGSLTIPGFPAISIACRFGRHRSSPERPWTPHFFIFAEADYPVPLLPGVVLRHLGLGLGVNQQLKGFDAAGVLSRGAREVLRSGLPQPSDPAHWVDADGRGGAEVALVAQSYVAPSQTGEKEPFPYVGRAIFYIKPTREFVLIFASEIWLFTSLDDARNKAEIMRGPLMTGMMTLFPKHGYLEAVALTNRNPRMSKAPKLVSDAIGMVQAEFSLKATPDLFRMRIGPVVVEPRDLPLGIRLRGSSLFAVEVMGGRILALSHMSLSGGLDLKVGGGLSLGPLKVRLAARLRAEVSFETLLAGELIAGHGFLFYGEALLHISAELSVELSLAFRLRIRVGFVKVTISWSKTLRTSIGITFDATLATLIGSDALALQGRARARFNVFGYAFNVPVSIDAGNTKQLEAARKRLGDVSRRLALSP